MEYYVYQLIDPRDSKIFYIGKGQKKRMYDHVKDVKRGRTPNKTNEYLGNKIKKILSFDKKIKYKKVFITKNEIEAYNKEKELIQKIGIINLCNLTEGGNGVIHTIETKKKLSKFHKGKTLSEDHKRKISDALKGRRHSNEHNKKVSESLKNRNFTEEHKRRISLSTKGKIPWNKGKIDIYSEDTKQKMSNAKRGRILTDEHKKKIGDALKGRKYRKRKFF